MSWAKFHKISESHAQEAHEHLRIDQPERARPCFERAAEAEEQALRALKPEDKARTFSITAVSAIALWWKAGNFTRARVLAAEVYKMGSLATFARKEIDDLLSRDAIRYFLLITERLGYHASSEAKELFKVWISAVYPSVMDYCHTLSGDLNVAVDIAHDALIRFIRHDRYAQVRLKRGNDEAQRAVFENARDIWINYEQKRSREDKERKSLNEIVKPDESLFKNVDRIELEHTGDEALEELLRKKPNRD